MKDDLSYRNRLELLNKIYMEMPDSKITEHIASNYLRSPQDPVFAHMIWLLRDSINEDWFIGDPEDCIVNELLKHGGSCSLHRKTFLKNLQKAINKHSTNTQTAMELYSDLQIPTNYSFFLYTFLEIKKEYTEFILRNFTALEGIEEKKSRLAEIRKKQRGLSIAEKLNHIVSRIKKKIIDGHRLIFINLYNLRDNEIMHLAETVEAKSNFKVHVFTERHTRSPGFLVDTKE